MKSRSMITTSNRGTGRVVYASDNGGRYNFIGIDLFVFWGFIGC